MGTPARNSKRETMGGRNWRTLAGWAMEEELGQVGRSSDQVVEVIPLIDGEDSPRRVLCPWRVHLPASTLPAVARATAGRFMRCEWLVGRGVGASSGSARGFCVSCSPHGCDRPSLGVSATGVVHAWVGQIVTFFATAPLAATWTP